MVLGQIRYSSLWMFQSVAETRGELYETLPIELHVTTWDLENGCGPLA